jgi:septal ring factor EnvC (AmiA/AmiB activator)
MLRTRGLWAIFLALISLVYDRQVTAGRSETAAKAKLEQVTARIQSLQDQHQSTQGEWARHNRTLRDTEQEIGTLTKDIQETKQNLARQKQQLLKLEDNRADAQEQLNQQRSSLGGQLRAAYAIGQQEKIKILLNQEDPEVVSRIMVYYDYFNSTRLKQMDKIQLNLRQLDTIAQKIAQEKTRLQQYQGKNFVLVQQLETAQEGRKEIISSLNNQLLSQDKELESLKSNKKQLQTLLLDIQKALVDIPLDPEAHVTFHSRKGQLPWPSPGELVALYGTQRKVGRLKWDGVLIAAPQGQEVRAIHHGRVAFSDWLRGFGLLLIIDHGDDYMSLYGHNQSLFKETGDWVEPGEVVAQVGNSGGQPSSGVYFGIRHNGQPVNPSGWCQRLNGRVIAVADDQKNTFSTK